MGRLLGSGTGRGRHGPRKRLFLCVAVVAIETSFDRYGRRPPTFTSTAPLSTKVAPMAPTPFESQITKMHLFTICLQHVFVRPECDSNTIWFLTYMVYKLFSLFKQRTFFKQIEIKFSQILTPYTTQWY